MPLNTHEFTFAGQSKSNVSQQVGETESRHSRRILAISPQILATIFKRNSWVFLVLMSCFTFEAWEAFVAVEGKQLPGERIKHRFLQERAQRVCRAETTAAPWTQTTKLRKFNTRTSFRAVDYTLRSLGWFLQGFLCHWLLLSTNKLLFGAWLTQTSPHWDGTWVLFGAGGFSQWMLWMQPPWKRFFQRKTVQS